MTADWYLFWQQNNARPEITPLELEMEIMNFNFDRAIAVIRTALVPAFQATTDSFVKFAQAMKPK